MGNIKASMSNSYIGMDASLSKHYNPRDSVRCNWVHVKLGQCTLPYEHSGDHFWEYVIVEDGKEIKE